MAEHAHSRIGRHERVRDTLSLKPFLHGLLWAILAGLCASIGVISGLWALWASGGARWLCLGGAVLGILASIALFLKAARA